MLLAKFIKALKPKILKIDILSDISKQQKELDTYVLPQYKEFNSMFSNYKFKAPFMVKAEDLLRKRLGVSKAGLMVEIQAKLEQIKSNLSTMDTLVEKYFQENTYKDAITLSQGNILQFLSATSFTISYARNLLTLAMIEEASAAGQVTSIRTVPYEQTRMEEKLVPFVNSIINTADKGSNITKRLEKIPNAFATDEYLNANKIASDYVDPFALNLLDSGFNPFYLFGMNSAESDAAKYHDTVEDFSVQESLLLNLKLAQSRQNDPKLEQKIQRQLERVQKCRRAIDDMERKFGLKE